MMNRRKYNIGGAGGNATVDMASLMLELPRSCSPHSSRSAGQGCWLLTPAAYYPDDLIHE